MKINKVLLYALLAVPAFTLQSCLKDQEDTFDKNATERLDDYLDEAQKTLMNSEYGWIVDVYPGDNQEYGGFAVTAKFSKNDVTLGGELGSSPTLQISSLYQLKKDAGAVLSFDSYNDLIHVFSNPNSARYEAYHGDFEFLIDSIGEDVVKVHGKRNRNTLYFRKLTKPMAQYLTEQKNVINSFQITEAMGNVNGKLVSLNINAGTATISQDGASESVAFSYTDEGISFYKPVNMSGVTVSEMKFDATTQRLTAGNDNAVVLDRFVSDYENDDEAFQSALTIESLQSATVAADAASWLHATVSGEQLQISADANTTSNMRRGSISVTLGDGSVKTITFTQCDVKKDIVGRYDFNYTDQSGTKEKGIARVEWNSFANSPQLRIAPAGSSAIFTFPAKWEESTHSLVITSGSYLGEASGYYVYSIFTDANLNSWTEYIPNVEARFTFDLADNGSGSTVTKATFGGEYTDGGITLGGIMLSAHNARQFAQSTSAKSNTIMLQPNMVKQ